MRHLRKRIHLFRLTTLVLMGTFFQACMSWRAQPVHPGRFSAPDRPTVVRVTLANGAKVVLHYPVIRGDSLIGSRSPGGATVLLADISRVEVQRFDAGKTALLAVGIGATVAIIGAAIAADGSEPSSSPPPPPTTSCGSGFCVGSCPHVYSWDGADWRLDSGTFGGAILRALARTDVDNLNFAAARDGVLRLKVANELSETDYVDALSVVAVDHDRDVTVAPDAAGRLYTIGGLTPPTHARDFRGRDALARVLAADGWNWESVPTGRDTAVTADIRDGLELTFPKPPRARTARLVVDGNNTPWAALMLAEFVAAHGRGTQAWYDSLEAAPLRARELEATLAREAFLDVSVWTGDRWVPQGLVWEAGAEIVKRQVLPLDLSRVQGDTVRIRLESVPSFWLLDQVSLDYSPERAVTVAELRAERAMSHDGQDVRDLLATADGRSYAMEPGESAELRFKVPPTSSGKSRTYLARSTGWYRLHTPEVEAPNAALLQRVATEHRAISRLAVARMNDALRAMEVAQR